MTIDRFKRLKLGSGLSGTDLGGGIIELEAPADTPPQRLLAQLYGPLPGSPGSSDAYRIPYTLGSSVSYTLARASLHLATAGSTSTQLVIEKSAESSSGFVATTVAILTLTSGNHDVAVTSSLGSLSSGELIRFRWVSLGTGAANFYAQLEGSA